MLPNLTFAPEPDTVLQAGGKFPFDVRVLLAGDDRADVFAVRYRAYRDFGYIDESPSGTYSDAADDWPSTALIAAYDQGVCVGVIRFAISQPWQPASALPCAAYYPVLHQIKARAERAVVEVGRLAIDPAITNTSYRTTLFATLVRACFIAAQAVNASNIVLTTRTDRASFHIKMLGFELVGEPAFYPPGDIPVALLAGTIGQAELKQRAQNVFFRIKDDEIASMRTALAPLTLPRPGAKTALGRDGATPVSAATGR